VRLTMVPSSVLPATASTEDATRDARNAGPLHRWRRGNPRRFHFLSVFIGVVPKKLSTLPITGWSQQSGADPLVRARPPGRAPGTPGFHALRVAEPGHAALLCG
jgi:hypothetical protein